METEAFTYTNIFATKGIEYLLIIGFLLGFLAFIRFLKEIEGPLRSLSELRLPREVLFDRTHTWVFMKSMGRIQVGIDDFIPALTGEVKLINYKNPGDTTKRGEHIATLKAPAKQLKLYAPISGTVKQINKHVIKTFSQRTQEDFVENWLYDIEPNCWDCERPKLLIGRHANTWIQHEKLRLRDVLAFAIRKHEPGSVPLALQEGGELSDGVLESLPAEIWSEFQTEFIDAVREPVLSNSNS